MIDKIFKKPIIKQFEFDKDVAVVFDDMLNRSVPFYKEMLELSVDFTLKYLEEGDIVYDLGCSTASTLLSLNSKSDKKLKLIGVDNSQAMLNRAIVKSKSLGADIDFICDDILNIELQKSKVIIANYTIQFIRPLEREKLIKKIFNSLSDGGVFIFSEKIISDNKILNKQFIDIYYNFKKNMGYSEYEIAQKREALENVLIPYSQEENIKMMKDSGFIDCETIFRWVNFSTFIAIKKI